MIVYHTEESSVQGLEVSYLHNSCWVPMYGVVVEISSRVKPRVELLFSVSNSLCIDVCMDRVGLSR